MKCPHLIKWLTCACKAQEKLYYPSDFQVYEYCKRKSHKKCPFYALRTNSEEIDRMVSTAHC
ncbi:MAG: hypothetical protein WC581_00275 [Thermodesulfovibrionales bacterium]